MINRKTLLISLLAALSGTCGGCSTQPPELKPLGKVTVKVSEVERPTRAAVQMGYEVILLLPPSQPPGYVWQISQHNSNTLQQLTEIIAPSDPSGESTISFLARRSGVTRVLFALVPPTAKAELEPADVQEVQLTID